MKKWIAMILAIVMVLGLCACADNGSNGGSNEKKEDEKVTASLLTKVVVTNSYQGENDVMDGVVEYDADYNVIGTKAYQDDKLVNEATYDMDPSRPLVEQDYDENGNPTDRAVYTYDEDGNQLTHTWFNEDGEVEWKYVYTYDRDGNMLTRKSYTGDELDYEIVCTYDEHGNLLTEDNEIGDWCNTFENTYENGKLTQVKHYSDGTLSTCTQYDSDGNEFLSIVYTDEEESERTESTYEKGKLIKSVTYLYGEESSRDEYTYSEDGKLTQVIYNYNDEYVYKTTFAYNDNGDVINVSRYNGDDLVSEIALTYETVTVSKEQAERIAKVQAMLGI